MTHDILGTFKGIDGQIALKLQNRLTDFKIGILGLYLSPYSFRFGQDLEGFFDNSAVMWAD